MWEASDCSHSGVRDDSGVRSILQHTLGQAHQGSMSMTWEAAVRLRATPPALRDMRNTVTPGSLVKALIMRSRASMLMLPSRRTHRMPTCEP